MKHLNDHSRQPVGNGYIRMLEEKTIKNTKLMCMNNEPAHAYNHILTYLPAHLPTLKNTDTYRYTFIGDQRRTLTPAHAIRCSIHSGTLVMTVHCA